MANPNEESWIFRLVQTPNGVSIHELCVDESGHVRTYTLSPVFLEGHSPEELKAYCEEVMSAFSFPIIHIDQLEAGLFQVRSAEKQGHP